LFVATSIVTTWNQTRSLCPGRDKKEACHSNADCIAGTYTNNGIITPTCDPSGYCVLNAWCPLENDSPQSVSTLQNVDNWTVFVKVNGNFPNFHISKSNIDNGLVNGTNLFSISSILQGAGGNTYQGVSQLGAVLLISIGLNCDFDQAASKCQPSFGFARIDDPTSKFSSGFNFRYVDRSYASDGTQTRTLYKVMGIRMIFNLYGVAGKFGIVPLLITLGAGVGLLSIATLVCDFVLQKLLPNRDVYVRQKIQEIDDDTQDRKERTPIVTDQ